MIDDIRTHKNNIESFRNESKPYMDIILHIQQWKVPTKKLDTLTGEIQELEEDDFRINWCKEQIEDIAEKWNVSFFS